MFGFFSRKPLAEPAITVDDSRSNEQLRTPSPSVDSAIGKNSQNLSPARAIIHDPPITSSPPPPGPSLPGDSNSLDKDLGLVTDPLALHSLISSIPPKTLHEYILARLIPSARSSAKPNTNINPPSSLTLTHLTSFFSTLTPPPQLHCVRCHKFYYEVENAERSCLVPHDDESAEVERVGLGRGADTQYETLYNCCGRTVEGEGDMGPPDGWCYEGKHTTDTKRARFRADSTIHNDKLTSCERLKCFEPIVSDDTSSESESSSRRPRKRKRSTRKREDAEAATEQPATDVAMDDADRAGDDDQDDTRSVTSTRSQSRLKKKLKSAPTSPLPSVSASTSTSKPRKKRAKAKHDDKQFKPEASASDDEDDDNMDVDESISARSKKAKRSSKSAAKSKTRTKTSTESSLVPQSVEFPTSASSRSSPTRHNNGESASGDERRQRKHSHSVSFAATTGSVGPSPKTGSASTKSSASATKPGSTSRRRTKKLEEVVASSVDGEM